MTHSEPLFNKLSVLNIRKLYMYNLGLLMYKHHHNRLPLILKVFKKNSDIHSYETRSSNMLRGPKIQTELGRRSFRYQAVKIWNDIFLSLSVDIKIGTFKKNLKSFLIKNRWINHSTLYKWCNIFHMHKWITYLSIGHSRLILFYLFFSLLHHCTNTWNVLVVSDVGEHKLYFIPICHNVCILYTKWDVTGSYVLDDILYCFVRSTCSLWQ